MSNTTASMQRNASKTAHTKTVHEVCEDLQEAFKKADTDSSGILNRSKMVELVHGLNITLRDMTMDLDALLGYKEIAIFVEPFIRQHQEKGLEMELDEIMKDAVSTVLSSLREQRNYINAGFLETSHKMEEDHLGFGVNFWGSTWRFRLYDDLYSSAKDAKTGQILPYSSRYANLKARLAGIVRGTDPWIFAATAADTRVRGEIGNPAGVQHFCRDWLAYLERAERCPPPAQASGDVSG